ncbi:MAG: WhiB family transcriptional regulator, redox-sensing transcriptional regulator [Actinomycetota bacterium]|jgi:WhiB family redox-sensing transcriptional regulator|nr:WhiB family transcriptional regulator, redox-sensing transcriptional regulator [Actinomycetota bacterium]
MTAIGSLFAAIGTPALPGARCRGRSHLFDDAAQGEPADTVEARHRQAIGLCQRCPALEQCGSWLDSLKPSQRPAGVVAGRTYHRNLRDLRVKVEQP